MSNGALDNLEVQLRLDIRPYAESMKSALNMAAMFRKQQQNILSGKMTKPDFSQFDNELKKLNSTLSKYQTETKQSDTATSKFNTETAKSSRVTRDARTSLMQYGQEFAVVTAAVYAATRGTINWIDAKVKSGTELKVLRDETKLTREQFELLRIATAGNMEESLLRQIFNEADALGITLEETAIMLAYIEEKSDGTTVGIQEGFQKMVYASEGAERGLRAVGIQTAAYKEILAGLVKEKGGLLKITQDEVGEQIQVISNLSAEEQKEIRKQALIKATGMSIEDVRNKTADAGDQVDIMHNAWKMFGDEFGMAFFSGMTQGIADENTELDKQVGLIDQLGTFGKIAGDAISFYIMKIYTLGGPDSPLGRIFQTIISLYTETDNWLIKLNSVSEFLKSQPSTEFLGGILDMIGAIVDKWQEFTDNVKPEGTWDAPVQKEAGRATVITTKKPPGNKTGSRGTKKEPELSEIQKLEKELAKLNVQYNLNSDSLLAQYNIQLKIYEVEKKLKELREWKPAQLGDFNKTYKPGELPPQGMREGVNQSKTMNEMMNDAIKMSMENSRNSPEFQAASEIFYEVAGVMRTELNAAWEDIFGRADSLLEKFVQKIITRFADIALSFAFNSLLNALFPLAGLAPSFFGGASAVGSAVSGGGGLGGSISPGSGGIGLPPVITNILRLPASASGRQVHKFEFDTAKLKTDVIELGVRRVQENNARLGS